MVLSKRLSMVANMVKPCDLLADIGTDHGYLPIFLYKNRLIKRAIATDISKGSCEKAERNISLQGVSEFIQVRFGDGLKVIEPYEQPDAILISGMGGMLAIDILNEGTCTKGANQLILQVQRDIDRVRRYIHSINFKIEAEGMVKEEGKFYTVISAIPGIENNYTEVEYYFGKLLLQAKNPVLKEYILKEYNKLIKVLSELNGLSGDEIATRQGEIEEKIKIHKEALECL